MAVKPYLFIAVAVKIVFTLIRIQTEKIGISVLTDRLGVLRKEVKLCDGIAERSGILREKLQTALAEEEKQKGKENRRHELRR